MSAPPTKYSLQLAKALCERLYSPTVRGLKSVCQDDDMPDHATVYRWLERYQTLRDLYARARELQADAMFEDILEIADDGSNDWMERRGERVVDPEAVARSKLRYEARRWMAGKLRPRKYGDKSEVALTGGDGGAITLQVVTGVERAPSDD